LFVRSVDPTGAAPRVTASDVFVGSLCSSTPALLLRTGPAAPPTCHTGDVVPGVVVHVTVCALAGRARESVASSSATNRSENLMTGQRPRRRGTPPPPRWAPPPT